MFKRFQLFWLTQETYPENIIGVLNQIIIIIIIVIIIIIKSSLLQKLPYKMKEDKEIVAEKCLQNSSNEKNRGIWHPVKQVFAKLFIIT